MFRSPTQVKVLVSCFVLAFPTFGTLSLIGDRTQSLLLNENAFILLLRDGATGPCATPPKAVHADVQFPSGCCGRNGGVAIAISSVLEYGSKPLLRRTSSMAVSQLSCSSNVGQRQTTRPSNYFVAND
ncbi:unnamed protein product [Ixodes persulcatus]